MEAVNTPGVISVELKETKPYSIGRDPLQFVFWLEINQARTVRIFHKAVPLGRNDGGMIRIFPNPQDAAVLVERDSKISFIR
jgi:hypothetical protein